MQLLKPNLALFVALLLAPLTALHAGDALVYKQAGERELKLFIEKPADWKASDKRPAIVFFFGGGWVGGTPEQFRKQSEYFATRGLVGVRVEYRTIPKGDAGPPTVCCADAKSALRYVRSHAAEQASTRSASRRRAVPQADISRRSPRWCPASTIRRTI